MSRLIQTISKKLTSIKKVRIRANTPTTSDDNLKGYLNPGFSVQFTEEWEGEELTESGFSSNIWFKDKNGDFYWSGGFEIETEPAESSIKYSDYLDHLSGFSLLKNIDCSDITIAVLDSGVNLSLSDLNPALVSDESKNYTNEDSIEDQFGHGSHVAGMIAGRGNEVFGLAKNSNFISHKIMTDSGVVVSSAVKASLDDLLQNDSIRIINMSFNMDIAEYNAMDILCRQLKESGKILVAAANEYDSQLSQGSFVPAYSDHVISIGVFSKEIFNTSLPEIHSSFDYLMPKTEFYSAYKNPINYAHQSGSSMNCAFVSGLIAMLLADNPAIDLQGIKQSLNQSSEPFRQLTKYSDQPKLYKNEID